MWNTNGAFQLWSIVMRNSMYLTISLEIYFNGNYGKKRKHRHFKWPEWFTSLEIRLSCQPPKHPHSHTHTQTPPTFKTRNSPDNDCFVLTRTLLAVVVVDFFGRGGDDVENQVAGLIEWEIIFICVRVKRLAPNLISKNERWQWKTCIAKSHVRSKYGERVYVFDIRMEMNIWFIVAELTAFHLHMTAKHHTSVFRAARHSHIWHACARRCLCLCLHVDVDICANFSCCCCFFSAM